MAQSNHGMFPTVQYDHMDEAAYASQPTQYQNPYFPHWNSDPRTAVQAVPDSRSTVSTTQSTAKPRIAARSNAIHARRNALQAHNDRNAQFLLPPGPHQYSSTQNTEQMVDSISRLCQNDGPWNPHHMRSFNVNIGHNVAPHAQEDYGHYRDGIRSDIDVVSDSGYQTQPAQSIVSNEPSNGGQELPTEFMLQTSSMNVGVVPDTSHSMVRTVSDQRSVSQHSSRSGRHKQKHPCLEPDCLVVSKCASEHKKHMLKHVKTFVCYEPNCKRQLHGFATINDLDRHKKSVHKIGIENSRFYRCASTACNNKSKVWPRLDNFKQHLERMHKDEDTLDLIKHSERLGREMSSRLQSVPVDTATLLAGMGESDSLPPNGSQVFPYQPSVSIHTGSFSSASQASPITAPIDGSFSPMDMTCSVQSKETLSTDQRTIPLTDVRSNTTQKRRRLSRASDPDIPSLSQAAHSSIHGRQTTPAEQSRLPQTKSAQQQELFEKLSKIVHEIGPNVFSDDEWANVPKALAGLLKTRSKSIRLQQRRSNQKSSLNVQYCKVGDCGFSGRPCDLKKHSKRHKKPYGCTYPKCHKKFGAKSDWKRHENSQHYQLETFRCDVVDKSGKKCGYHCWRSIQLQNHLAEKHEVISDSRIQAIIKRCTIGKNCQGQYWCGFCCEIKVLETSRNDAWAERFNHIAFHFEKEGRLIGEWLCVEANKTKKELHEEVDRDFTGATGVATDADTNDDNDELSVGPEDWSHLIEEMPQDCSGTHSTVTNRQQAHVPTEDTQPSLVRFCCDCKQGPFSHHIHVSCPSGNCTHIFCNECRLEWDSSNRN